VYSVRKLNKIDIATGSQNYLELCELIKNFFAGWQIEPSWLNIYNTMDTVDIFVVKCKDTIVGMCICSYVSILVSRRAIIDLVQISEAHRNKGLGTKLIEYVIHYLENADVDCVELNVAKNNEYAIRAYKRNNFEVLEDMSIMRKIFVSWKKIDA